MIDCTDCKRELEEDEAISVAYQVKTNAGVTLMEVELPLCIDCTLRRESFVRKKKRRKKDGTVR